MHRKCKCQAYTRRPMTGAAPDVLGEAPCDVCKWRERCASQRWACEAFSCFVAGVRWAQALRAPSRPRWEAIYGPADPAERARERLERLRQARAKRERARAHPAIKVPAAAQVLLEEDARA